MKVKLIEVGDGMGTVLLPLPHEFMEQLGWNEGDEVILDIPMGRGGVMIITKKEGSNEKV